MFTHWNFVCVFGFNLFCLVFFFCASMSICFQLKRRQDRATPVFIASQNGHRTVLHMLLIEGADPNACRIDGASPLWIAAQMGHDHICRLLLKNGARVDAVRCVSANSSVYSDVYFVSYAKRLFFAFYLQDGASPLFKAAHKGFSAVVNELLKYRPNLSLLPVSANFSLCERHGVYNC